MRCESCFGDLRLTALPCCKCAGQHAVVASDKCKLGPVHTGPCDLPEKAAPDMVNSPPHYTGVVVRGKRRQVEDDRLFSDGSIRASIEIEAIDVIEALQLGYHLGTVFKYLWRAGKKGSRVEDLKKARWFLDREIAKSERSE